MAKKPNVKVPVPKDLVKLITKIIKNQAPTARKIGTRQVESMPKSLKSFAEVANSTKYADFPSSAFPKVKPTAPVKPKKLGKPLATGTVKPEPAPPRPTKPKKVMSTPPRPTRAPSLKGRTLPKTAAEIREAERQGRRSIKIASGTDPKPSKSLSKPKTDAKPVDVKGSIVAVPSKATMRPPKPSKGSYEADKTKGVIKGDRELFGRGQKPPKSALTYAEREAIRKAKDAERLAALKKGPSVQAGELRKAVDAAKSPKQKKVAQQNLIDFLLKKK
jgi:hypothetical protein